MAQPQEVHDPPCTPNRNMHERMNNQIQLNRRDINTGSNIAQEAQIVTQPSVTNVTDMMNVTFAQVQYPIQAIQSAVSLQHDCFYKFRRHISRIIWWDSSDPYFN